MGSPTLLEEWKRDGASLVRHLRDEGHTVENSAWLLDADDQRWKLMLATSLVEFEGVIVPALRTIIEAIRRHPEWWVTPDQCHPVGVHSQMAQALVNANRRSTSFRPAWLEATRLGGVDVDGVYVYPPETALAYWNQAVTP